MGQNEPLSSDKKGDRLVAYAMMAGLAAVMVAWIYFCLRIAVAIWRSM